LSSRALYQGRDLAPTLDLRAVFKSVLADQLSVSNAAIERDVFPGSEAVRASRDLVRA
jgi:uncharacterized protein (DUF1501 family)